MTIPATPIKLAALRYSPEMALAFHPTLTLRPATKKSLAVFDLLADQKPIQMVAATVRALKARMKGSMFMGWGWEFRAKEAMGAKAAKKNKTQQVPCSQSSLRLLRSLRHLRAKPGGETGACLPVDSQCG